MSDLKPCPFCGSTATVWGLGGYKFFVIECDNEQCGCSYGDNMQLSLKEVIKMWNKRTKSEE